MSSCEKLLRKMRRTKSGWSQQDFQALYTGFGFSYREGKAHRVYYHEKYAELAATVARHDELAKGYAEHAIDVITQLRKLEARDRRQKKNVEQQHK